MNYFRLPLDPPLPSYVAVGEQIVTWQGMEWKSAGFIHVLEIPTVGTPATVGADNITRD